MARFRGRDDREHVACEIASIVGEYLDPAVCGLKEGLQHEDLAAVRAYAFEIAVVAGTVAAATPAVGRAREPA